jgi:hypothetical protein
MQFHSTLAFLLLLLLHSGCRKESSAVALGATNDGCTPIEGISATDVNGGAIFEPDPNDWQVFDQWCPEVEDLFHARPNTYYTLSLPDTLITAGYPNPCTNQFSLYFGYAGSASVDLRFVNEQHQLLLSMDSVVSHQVQIQTDALVTDPPELIRVYYRIAHADGSVHRGHGDIGILD